MNYSSKHVTRISSAVWRGLTVLPVFILVAMALRFGANGAEDCCGGGVAPAN